MLGLETSTICWYVYLSKIYCMFMLLYTSDTLEAELDLRTRQQF